MCTEQNTQKNVSYFVPLVRGCAHFKVYLKWFNEAWSNGSWSCRHTSLTLFQRRQWARRKYRVPSDWAAVGKPPVWCIWESSRMILVKWPFFFLMLAHFFFLSMYSCVQGLLCWLQWTICFLLAFLVFFSAFFLADCCKCFAITPPFSPSVSLWTQCTTSCGPGYQMRAVKCVVGSYGAVMDDTECNAATRPTDTQVTGCYFPPFPTSCPSSPHSKSNVCPAAAFWSTCVLTLKMYTEKLPFNFHLVSIKTSCLLWSRETFTCLAIPTSHNSNTDSFICFSLKYFDLYAADTWWKHLLC